MVDWTRTQIDSGRNDLLNEESLSREETACLFNTESPCEITQLTTSTLARRIGKSVTGWPKK